jgi:alginate O-acetyltransferase complex protein AlgI
MLFNSLEFTIFLPLLFIIYWFIVQRNLKMQNALLLVASYIFYGWWDWRFLTLIFLSSIVDFMVGRKLGRTNLKSRRKKLLYISLITNLGLLGFFKYCNFFIDSFIELFGKLGIHVNNSSLNIILPVGISFYTFQTLSYTLDIYRNKMNPTDDALSFFSFVSFFPQLVAGPIERASNLLPQFQARREFDYEKAKDGMRQILWGLFKKIAVADVISVKVDVIFGKAAAFSGIDLFIGVFLFAIQIYCDFSGYSDIAIGTARLFGFRLMRNFAYPFYSRNIGEFWQRWHISLSTWFRDYVYIPLGGSKQGKAKQVRNALITFTVSGFWHGANWTFIFWGFLNGLYFIPLIFQKDNKRKDYRQIVAHDRWYPTFSETVKMTITFLLFLLGLVFFRSVNIGVAFDYLSMLITHQWMVRPTYLQPLVPCFVVLVVEWLQRTKPHALAVSHFPLVVRRLVYYAVLFSILSFGNFGEKAFIYFQF